jgi:glycosyltransferase involved in cell wall biosynthesis
VGKNEATLHHQSQKELLTYSFKAYKKAEDLLQKNHYDVIHAFFGIPCGVLAWRLGKKYQVPYIISLRGADVPGYSERFSFIYAFLTPLIKKVWKEAYKVVSNSQGLKELALQSAPKQEISIIPNGVDTENSLLLLPHQNGLLLPVQRDSLSEKDST